MARDDEGFLRRVGTRLILSELTWRKCSPPRCLHTSSRHFTGGSERAQISHGFATETTALPICARPVDGHKIAQEASESGITLVEHD
jgi:hypothetical protein